MNNSRQKSRRLMTLKLVTILILSFWSSTALSQSTDSTICFTQEQVKTFLRTKAELDFCLESNEILLTRVSNLEDENQELGEEKTALEDRVLKVKKQRNRSRWISAGTSLVGILSTILFFMK